ncbi:MAG: DRTGG domain-containing protein [Bacteroides sp.]|nr:DRTGG domain-containing protein [Bacteroides sp.]
MTVNDVRDLLSANVLTGQTMLSREVRTACGSDMMSDVLAYIKDNAVLLTGLLDPQVITTAEMMGIVCVVFVRGKTPDSNLKQLADEMNVPVLTTNLRMFEACGILYSEGLGANRG